MIEKLKEIIKKYPYALNNRQKLRALLLDYFPDKKKESNILLMVFDEDIFTEIQTINSIDKILMTRYIKILVDNYGINADMAQNGIENWGYAFDIKIKLKLINNIPIEENKNNVTEIDAEISNYEIEKTDKGIVLKKFVGFDKDEIVIPNTWDGDKIVEIGENAFAGCKEVKTIIVPNGVESIGNGAFSKCILLKKVVLPSNLQYLGETVKKESNFRASETVGVFEETAISTIIIPSEVKYIGTNCFSNCLNLLSINIPKSVKIIDEGAFFKCYRLKQVMLSEGIEKIGQKIFSDCYNLSAIVIPNTVKCIDHSAFYGCGKLSSVTINEGVEKIKRQAFSNCKMLKKILIPRSVTEIDDKAFSIEGWSQPYDRRRNGFSTSRINDEIVIYCYMGSKGLEYARKLGFKIENAVKA